jgi:asparagine synthase (glutamine-hydrolysing)
MCGFTGIFRQPGTDSGFASELTSMVRALVHRGPDSEGIWHDERGSIGLGHRRLSIQDISPLGHQPMHSRSGRYVIAFNGEVYNFLELRADLVKLGATFRGESDTEVMLAAIEQWGIEKALERFSGMFAIALWDQRERELHLVRDRIGEKPLYYGWQGDSFVFGSELKALRRCRDWKGEIDRNVLPLLLRFNYVPTPFSIYRDVYKLPPGTIVTLSERSGRAVQLRTYWSATKVFDEGMLNPLNLTAAETVDELEGLLRESVRQQMISDVPLGAFLSGGVDSSTVVALMQSISNVPIKTFTIGFDIPGYDEAKHAKNVSAHLGTDHTELYVTPLQAMEVIPTLGEMYDEPFADSSQIPTHLVSKLARSKVTVSLSGDGGDELFCGYDRYFDICNQWRRHQSVPRVVRRAAARIGQRVPERAADVALYPFFGMFSTTRRANLGRRFHKRMDAWLLDDLKDYYRHIISLWTRPAGLVLGADELQAHFGNGHVSSRLASSLRHLMYLDVTTYLPDDILVKVDRAAMAVSLETRIPFLNHRIVEFASRIPLEIQVKDTRGKWPLRQILYRHVPRDLVDRPKAGFEIPIANWLRGPLKPWAQELLDVRRLRSDDVFDAVQVDRVWQQHLAGGDDYTHSQLWGILIFQSWLDCQRSQKKEHKSAVSGGEILANVPA